MSNLIYHFEKMKHIIFDKFDIVKKYISRISWLFSIIEIFVGLIFGTLLGGCLGGYLYAKWWWAAITLVGLLYFVLLRIKFASQTLFPEALVSDLKSEILLEKARKELSRRKSVANSIAASIERLNKNTCTITSGESIELCEQNVIDGLKELLYDLINKPNEVLGCNGYKFSIVCFVRYREKCPLGWHDNVLILRDDIGVQGLIDDPKRFLELELLGEEFELQTIVCRCYKNNKFVRNNLSVSGKNFNTITVPLPLICESAESNGVLLFVADCDGEFPDDLQEILSIFARIVTNWLSRYSDCTESSDRENKKLDENGHCLDSEDIDNNRFAGLDQSPESSS